MAWHWWSAQILAGLLVMPSAFAATARADDPGPPPSPAAATPSPVPAPAPEEGPPNVMSLSFALSIALKRPQAMPLGFDGDSLLEPYDLVFSLRKEPEPHHPSLNLGINASFPRYALMPAWGVTPGLAFNAGGLFVVEGALDLQDQKSVNKAPFSGSQFDAWIVSLIAGARFAPLPIVTLGLEGRLAFFFKTQIAAFEELETDLSHQASLILSPWVGVELPFQLKARARLDFDELGSTAIASKEFALGIAAQTIERLQLSVSRRFGPWGIEGRYAWVTGYRDATELSYQAPFYYRDYLLSPQSLTLEVTWYF